MLTKQVRRIFENWGREGGRRRARRMNAADRRSAARLAVLSRWKKRRFGAGSYASMALPGGELVDAGIRDLAARRKSAPALLISIAYAKLARCRVPLPRGPFPNADVDLYRLIEREAGDALAHARYNALIRRICSFTDAIPAAVRRARRSTDAKNPRRKSGV